MAEPQATVVPLKRTPEEVASDLVDSVLSPRSGRPRGLPKTGGRKPGSRNKASRDIRALAQRYTSKSLRGLWKLADGAAEEDVRLKAHALLLAYGHGKPTETQQVGGIPGGSPIASTTRVESDGERTTATAKAMLAVALAASDKPEHAAALAKLTGSP